MSFELVGTASVTPVDPSGASGSSAKRRRGETQNKLPSLEDFDDVPKGMIMDMLIPNFKNMSCEQQRRECIQMDPEHQLFSNGMCNDGHFKQLHESTCESEAVYNIFYEELNKETVPLSKMTFLKTRLDKMNDKGVKNIDWEGDGHGKDVLNRDVLFSAKYAEEFILTSHDIDANLFHGISKRLPRLKKLCLYRPPTTIVMKEGTVFENLTELQVTGESEDTRFERQKTVDPTFFERLPVMFPNLEVVFLQDLVNNDLRDGIRMLPNKKLKKLTFGQPMESCGYDLRFLNKFQNLRYIEITSFPSKFPNVEGLASLETLIVGHTVSHMYPEYNSQNETFWESGEGSKTTMSVNRSMKSLTNLKNVTIYFQNVLRFDDNDSPFPEGLKSLSLISVWENIPDEVISNWDTSTCEVHLPAHLPDALTKININTEFPGNILPEQIASLPNVEELNLYSLGGFPPDSGGDGMKKLKKLTMRIAYQPLDLRHLIKLEQLTIRDSFAGVLPRLEGLSSLKKITIRFSDTKIEVPVYFSALTNLESFSLTTGWGGGRKNEITVNRNIDFSRLRKLKNITLNHGTEGKIFIFANILSLPEDAEVRGVSKDMIPRWMKKLYKERSKQLFFHLD